MKTTNVDILLCVCVCVQESTLHRQRSTYSGNRTSTAKEHKELVRVSSAFFHPAFKNIIFLAQFFYGCRFFYYSSECMSDLKALKNFMNYFDEHEIFYLSRGL